MFTVLHECLKDILLVGQFSKKKIEFFNYNYDSPAIIRWLIQLVPSARLRKNLLDEFRHFQMGINIICSRQTYDIAYITEAFIQHCLFLLPMLVLVRRTIIICFHGEQEEATHRRAKAIFLNYLKIHLLLFRRLKVVLFEVDDDVIPKKYRFPVFSKIVIPFPRSSEASPRYPLGSRIKNDDKIRIGVVGMMRKNKPITNIFHLLRDFSKSNQNCEVIIGTPFWQKPDYLDDFGFAIYDTSLRGDYLKLLRSIDILVTDYSKIGHYYRASGIISDAGSSGCFIICPDYPVIKNQISWPVQIGFSYTCHDEIIPLIKKAIKFIHENGQDNHWMWREKRSIESVAKILLKDV
jgi:hypothetical protein